MKQEPSSRSWPRLSIILICMGILIILIIIASCNGRSSDNAAHTLQTASFPSIKLTKVAGGFTEPTYITHAGDGSGRLFVVERKGLVRVVRDGAVLATPFLNITGKVQSRGGEQGLFSIAFPPGYASKNYFYVDYTNRSGVGNTAVARYPLSQNPDMANAAGEAVLLSVTQPFANHNGGQLAFGPDGFLYVGMGDGGSGGDPMGNGQNPAALLGKLLRLDVESGVAPYAVPAGNPFATEVWAYGLRNPWRFSFDRVTGDLYIADVGQNRFEEVNVQGATSKGGENYGWNIMEGLHCFSGAGCNQAGLTLPVAEYDQSNGDCSITGGYVYRGLQFPTLQGIYFYGDFCSGRIWGLRRSDTGWDSSLLLDSELQISSFGEDEAGNVYVADFGTGDLYRLDPQ